jgi:hypothetical protein
VANLQSSSPITVAGQRRFCTAFPAWIHLCMLQMPLPNRYPLHNKKPSQSFKTMRAAPCFFTHRQFSCTSFREGTTESLSRQVFWLVDRPTLLAFPSTIGRQWHSEFRSHLQRRDRSRLTRDSLFAPLGPASGSASDEPGCGGIGGHFSLIRTGPHRSIITWSFCRLQLYDILSRKSRKFFYT